MKCERVLEGSGCVLSSLWFKFSQSVVRSKHMEKDIKEIPTQVLCQTDKKMILSERITALLKIQRIW